MAAHETGNTTAFIEAQKYSDFIITNLHDGMLPDGFTRDVSDFASGTTLNIKTVGSAVVQDVQEGVAMTFNPIDTGTVTLAINNYKGDAWSISDELREDGDQVEQLSALRALEATKAIQEVVETSFLTACNAAQTSDDSNLVNGVKHRFYAGGTSKALELEDIAYLKFAFDKANVPTAGRILLVDPIVELTMNTLAQLVNVSNNIRFEGIVTEGFARDHTFLKNVYGFDIWTSNRLPVATADESSIGDRDGGAVTGAAGDIYNLAMCVADDNCKPMMRAWRKMPSVEGWRDNELREDRFQQSGRFGFGAQRTDTIATLITSGTAY